MSVANNGIFKAPATFALATMAVLGSSVGAFCAAPTVAITTEMLSPVVDSLVANIGVIMPIGITIFGIMLGIRMVPRIVTYFTH